MRPSSLPTIIGLKDSERFQHWDTAFCCKRSSLAVSSVSGLSVKSQAFWRLDIASTYHFATRCASTECRCGCRHGAIELRTAWDRPTLLAYPHFRSFNATLECHCRGSGLPLHSYAVFFQQTNSTWRTCRDLLQLSHQHQQRLDIISAAEA